MLGFERNMEPVTHLLTGACLARSGFNRKAAYATLAMTLAAEAPDLDTLWGIGGPVAAFQHHRGWTHTFVGLPLDGLAVLGTMWLMHRWRTRKGLREQAAPVRWGLLYGFILVALLSHLFLDWTNNYGLRPFFPFDARWYAGSFVFIVEPVLLLFLSVGLVAPALFGLINSEVGERRPRFRGRGWAIAALLGCIGVWGVRFFEHAQALAVAENADYAGAQGGPAAQVQRVYASPYPLNPFRWATVAEMPMYYQRGRADSWAGTLSTHAEEDTYYKPPTTLATLVAKRSWLGEVYLDWSPWPLVTESGKDADGNTTVTFRDLRFLYDTTLTREREEAPLSGKVVVDADHRVARMEMDGRVQR